MSKLTPKQKRDLADQVSAFNSLTTSVKAQEKQAKAMKTAIGDFVRPYADQFADGDWVLLGPSGERVGAIKEVRNAPRLVRTGGLELTEVEAQKLLSKLPERYLTRTFNVKLMQEEIDAKELAAVLAKQGITVVQDTRFDIKP